MGAFNADSLPSPGDGSDVDAEGNGSPSYDPAQVMSAYQQGYTSDEVSQAIGQDAPVPSLDQLSTGGYTQDQLQQPGIDKINSTVSPLDFVGGAVIGGVVKGIATEAVEDTAAAISSRAAQLGVQTTTEGLSGPMSEADLALQEAGGAINKIFGNKIVKYGLTGAAAEGTMIRGDLASGEAK